MSGSSNYVLCATARISWYLACFLRRFPAFDDQPAAEYTFLLWTDVFSSNLCAVHAGSHLVLLKSSFFFFFIFYKSFQSVISSANNKPWIDWPYTCDNLFRKSNWNFCQKDCIGEVHRHLSFKIECGGLEEKKLALFLLPFFYLSNPVRNIMQDSTL